jgi:chorismate dehydratase
VDGVSISSRGAVWSVFVAHPGGVEDIRRIVLDPASLTSVNLCKVLFAERGGPGPEYLPESAAPSDYLAGEDAATKYPGTARLLIGNQAIEFRERYGSMFRYLDLGQAWLELTGLPFVFAVWLMRPQTTVAGVGAVAGVEVGIVAEAFRAIAAQGQEDLQNIIAAETAYSQEFTRRYLTEHIRFGLGEAEKAGMLRFRELLVKHGLLGADVAGASLRFV